MNRSIEGYQIPKSNYATFWAKPKPGIPGFGFCLSVSIL